MTSRPGQNTLPDAEQRLSHWMALAACALLLVRSLAWLQSELWYDEVLSLQLFVQRPGSLWELFRDYRIANNHFLANALLWCWTRICPVAYGSEVLLRLPALLCGMGTLLTIALGWRRFLGAKIAGCTALLVAASPVFAAFAYQMRGYSLAFLLAACAVTAAAARAEAPSLRNAAGLFLSSLLLPLVMPSAAVLPMALVASEGVGFLCSHRKRADFSACIRRIWPTIAGVTLGCAYYFTLWAQFQRARHDSGGWPGSTLVAMHLLLAFALHLSVLLIPLLARLAKSPRIRHAFVGAALAILAVLAIPTEPGHAPFPRVFLVLLPMITLAAATAAKEVPWIDACPWQRLAAIAILPGLLLGIATSALTERQLETREKLPQNLLMQFYREADGNRAWAQRIAELPPDVRQKQLIAVTPADAPSFLLYCQYAGIEIIDENTGVPRIFAGNQPLPQLKALMQDGYELSVFARTEHELRDILRTQGIPEEPPVTPSQRLNHRTLYQIRPASEE